MPDWNVVMDDVVEEMIKSHMESLNLKQDFKTKYEFNFNAVKYPKKLSSRTSLP
jgi:hypothetical protein